ncbi:MAG: c-type cytochrome [Planctomycetes bacterium]|uniref:ethylbenzene dehydrogenase-related protein n=1 Tax=Candidatus Wunengus californicus TaxID=3367619 RepID=UPI004027FFED|nr:c-type cytochrome [Planctomycetota bacterium]
MIKAFKSVLVSLGLIVVTTGILTVRSEVSAQTSHLFRTYKHEVPQKLSETSEAIAEGKKVYEKRCWYCHGIEGKGDGPASKTMFPKPRNFTRNEYKVRSTAAGSVPTDEDLFRIITSGIEGTAMPFWSTISETERWQAIYYIKTFNEQFKKDTAPKVVSVGSVASTPDSIKRGQELFKETKCYECHGEDGRGNGPLTVALQTEWNMPYRARDLSKAWNFKGGNATEDIYRTISTGFNETPMGSYLEKLSDEDRWHVAHYVKSLSKDMASDVVVKVKLFEGEQLPAEPLDENWSKATPVEVPLAGQILTSPRHWAPSIDAVMIKALYNRGEIAFLVEWDDSTNKQEEIFRDAVSLQFPTKIPESLKKPYFAMGDSSGAVNLWSWKAHWSEGFGSVAEAPESEPGKMIEMNAKGFKNIVTQPPESQNVTGKGIYLNGRWKVVMKRTLKTEDAKGDIQFEIGKLIPIAFAVWDGSNSDVAGQKSVSSWYYVSLEKPVPKTVFVYVLIAIVMGASVEMWFVARLRRFPPKLEEEGQ